MKAADEEVQRYRLKNMTPAVVTQLIKQGINPLEMKIFGSEPCCGAGEIRSWKR